MLSVNSGSFAPMTYNYQQTTQPSIGMAGNGFASRGKAQNIRRISVPAPQGLSPPSDNAELASVPTPRTGRAQLLAGLRTAPKTPTTATLPQEAANGFDASRYASQRASASALPLKSARSLGFPSVRGVNQVQQLQQQQQQYAPRSSPPLYQQSVAAPQQQSYNNNNNLPTPPSTSPHIGNSASDQEYEAKVYAELLAQNIYLAQQQQLLQQQLRSVQQAQQFQQVHHQFSQLNVQSPMNSHFSTPPISPAVYSNMQNVQSLQNAVALQNAGYCSVYNPMTGQYNYYLAQQQQQQQPQLQHVQKAEQEVQNNYYTAPARRSPSPPKIDVPTEKSTTPQPFRRAHRKCASLSMNNANMMSVEEGPKTSIPTKVPMTPMNASANGQSHPFRQPKTGPAVAELIAKPSLNFASRTRRQAFAKLINAGERRNRVTTGSHAGSISPISEGEITLNFDDTASTSSSSGRHSSQSMRGGDSASSLSGDESYAGKVASAAKPVEKSSTLKPRLVFASADKRKSALF